MSAKKPRKAASGEGPPRHPDAKNKHPASAVEAAKPPLGATFRAEDGQRALDAIPDVIFILDTQYRIVWANKTTAERLRLTKDQCVGRTCHVCVHGTDAPPSFCPHSLLLRDGEEHTAEVHEERLAGDFLVTVSPLRDSAGRLVGSVHVARDIGERRIENDLRQREKRFSDLAELLPQVVFEIDLEGRLTFVNRQAQAKSGYAPADFEAGLTFLDMIVPADLDRARQDAGRALQGQDVTWAEYTARRKDGSQFPVSVCCSRILRDGAPVGLRGIVFDLTELKKAQESLRKAEQETATLNRIANVFLTVPDDEVYAEVLTIVLGILKSPFGLCGFIDDDGNLVVPGMTQGTWDACRLSEKSVVFPPSTWGDKPWGRAIRERRPYCSAGPFHTPPGHVPILSFLAVPIVFGDETIGLIAAANKEEGFTGEDTSTLESIAASISPILHARRQRERLNAELDDRVRRRTAQLAESEERYRRLFQENIDAILVHEMGPSGPGPIVEVNDATVRLLGYSREELLRMAPLAFETPRAPEETALLAEKMRRGETVVFERVGVAKDGRKIVAEIHCKPFQWQGTLRVLSQVRDITERRRTEQQIADALSFSQKVLETSPVGILTYKASGRCVSVNPAACRITGATAEQLLAQDFRRIDPWKRSGLLAAAEESLTSRARCSREARMVSSFGKEAWFEAHFVPLDIEGEPHLLLLVADIMDRKQAEEALRESEKRRAERERLAATAHMASRLAHEINNPLAGIQNSFRLIRSAVPEDHPDHDMVERIEREIDRIANIVRQMYTLYSPRAEKMAEVVVAEAIRDVLVMLEPLRRECEVTFDASQVPPGLTARVIEGSLHQILYNLLTNAIEASPRKAVVTVAAELADDRHGHDLVEIAVRDQGAGIPTEIRPRILEPFFTSKTDEDSRPGLGLGLSIVRSIVESVGGRIEFDSIPGQGTTFRVSLPHNPKTKEP